MIINTLKASRKYIRKLDREENGKSNTVAFAIYNKRTQQHEIIIPYHAGLKTRLHEIAHCVLKHCMDNRTRYPLSEHISQELDAELWAYEKAGKKYSMESLANIAYSAIIEYGGKNSYVFSAILNHLKSKNLVLEDKQKSFLWWECRNIETVRKMENQRDNI